MNEGKPARVFIAERLGEGDYATGAVRLGARLAEARVAWLQVDRWKSVAALMVVASAAGLVAAMLALLGRSWSLWVAVMAPLMALLFVAILCRASIEGYARFGRAPHAVVWLVPNLLGAAMAKWLALVVVDSGDVFAGLAPRQVVASAGGVEIDPRLFDDCLWPLLLSPDAWERRRAAWREYGYRGDEITFREIGLDKATFDTISAAQVTEVQSETANIRHPFQRISYQARAAWIEECLKRKGYLANSYLLSSAEN